MRRLKADVSHRIRRRRTILSAGWARLGIGVAAVIALGLLFGPSVAGWLGTELPRRVSLLSGWRGPGAPASVGSVEKGGNVQALPTDSPPALPAASPAAASAGTAGKAADASGVGGRSPARASAPSATPAPPGRFRIQVGAFQDHRNADRLAERLRHEGFGATASVAEQGQELYRVVVAAPDGAERAVGTAEEHDKLAERLRGLGFSPTITEAGMAVTAPVPLEEAVRASHRLSDEGIWTRLRQESGSTTYRVVRVGPYGTREEAERALSALAGRGIQGFVVRESEGR